MKLIILGLFLLFAGCLGPIAAAGERHNPPNYTVVNEYISNYSTVINEQDCTASASSHAAANINPYWSTNRAQMMVAYGNAGGCDALMIGLAKRFSDTGPMFSLTVGHSQGRSSENGFGAGLIWLVE